MGKRKRPRERQVHAVSLELVGVQNRKRKRPPTPVSTGDDHRELWREPRVVAEALIACEGSTYRAARLLGVSRDRLAQAIRDDPALVQIAKKARRLVAERAAAILRPWAEIAPKAQRVLVEALSANRVTTHQGQVVDMGPDWKVRVEAAQAILDRALGKPVARVEGDVTHRAAPQLDAETAHRAMAVSLVRGLPAVEAVDWVRQHPEEAEQILQAFRALAGARGAAGGDGPPQNAPGSTIATVARGEVPPGDDRAS